MITRTRFERSPDPRYSCDREGPKLEYFPEKNLALITVYEKEMSAEVAVKHGQECDRVSEGYLAPRPPGSPPSDEPAFHIHNIFLPRNEMPGQQAVYMEWASNGSNTLYVTYDKDQVREEAAIRIGGLGRGVGKYYYFTGGKKAASV